jgi:hypothetical protein
MRVAGERPDLKDLVDNPSEVLDVELKDWMDLATDRVAQANVARHLAALANHGGGYLVFGFDDSRMPKPSNPFPMSTFDRDRISAIVQKYLTPTFQCEVDFVTSSAGITHPVVWVPSHGAAPVCSKADGPQDEKGRPQGIKMATYYIRAPGPQSVPITTVEHWSPLIRRCIVHERTTLVGMFDGLLRPPAPLNPSDILKRWHERAEARFVELAQKRKAPPSIMKSRFELSYSIRVGDDQMLDPGSLIEVLRQVNREVHDLMNNPMLFYPYTREEIAPYFTEDPDGEKRDREILEAAIFPDMAVLRGTIDLWRVSLDGLATQVLPFWEDREDLADKLGGPGTWFCPFYMVRHLAQLVRHARAFAERFAATDTVEFRCEWRGLAGREVADPNSWVLWLPGKIARSDHRVTTGEWPVAELVTWPRIVSILGGPVMRLFDPTFDFSPEWVALQQKRFR